MRTQIQDLHIRTLASFTKIKNTFLTTIAKSDLTGRLNGENTIRFVHFCKKYYRLDRVRIPNADPGSDLEGKINPD
jgi:hypothetical protein